MKQKYNSHYGSYSKNRYLADLDRERNKPTAKQKKFYGFLRSKLIESGLDPYDGQDVPLYNRAAYGIEINRLLKLCKDAGIDTHGNGKDFEIKVEEGLDSRGRDVHRERLALKE